MIMRALAAVAILLGLLLTGLGTAQYQPIQPPDPSLFVAREDLAGAGNLSGAQRILRFVQVSDAHIIDDDAPPPMRSAPLDALFAPITSSAERPQEEYTDEVLNAIVASINGVHRADLLDFVVSTGDNIDNEQENELMRFIDNWEGTFTTKGPISGFDCLPDGQSADLEDDSSDVTAACTHLPEAMAGNNTALAFGLPWYSAFGNHDGLIQGNVPIEPSFQEAAAEFGRYFLDQDEYVAMHFAAGSQCAGGAPAGTILDDYGHGFGYAGDRLCDDDPDNDGYYSFTVRGVHAIVLDTVNDDFVTANENLAGFFNPQLTLGYDLIGGYAEGAVDPDQYAWLEAELAANTDKLVLLFSHHTVNSMFPDEAGGLCGPPGCLPNLLREAGYKTGDDLIETLTAYPNVAAWIGGHTHQHRIQAKSLEGAASPGFWNVETSSLVDMPQEARVIELWQTADGKAFLKLERFGHDYQPSLQLAAGDVQFDAEEAAGQDIDQDVLLWVDVPSTVLLEPQPLLPRTLDLRLVQPESTGNGTALAEEVQIIVEARDSVTGAGVPGLSAAVTITHQPGGGGAIATDLDAIQLVEGDAPGLYQTPFTPTEAATHFVTVEVAAKSPYPETRRVFSFPAGEIGAAGGDGEDTPALPLALVLVGLALLAVRRRPGNS